MKPSYILLLALAIGCGNMAWAQNLSTEITLERTVLPEQRQASRPSIMPSLISIENFDVNLNPAEYLHTGSITSSISTLPASPWGASVSRTPYRGYVSASYFPTLNFNGAAGYRILDHERYNLGIWAQGTATRYKHQGIRMEQIFATGGAYGSVKVGDYSLFSADLDYTYSSIIHPHDYALKGQRVGNNLFNVNASWDSHPGNLRYYIGAGFDIINMAKLNYDWCPEIMSFGFNYDAALMQQNIKLQAGIGLCHSLNTIPWLGLDLDAQILNTNHNRANKDEFHVRPYFHWNNEILDTRIGVNLSLESGDNPERPSIAPDVRFAFQPQEGLISGWISVTGGQKLNTLRNLYLNNYFISPYLSYRSSNTLVDAEAAVNVGRLGGLSFQIFGGVAKAKHWFSPMLLGTNGATNLSDALPYWLSPYGGTVMGSADVLGWHAGLKLDFAYRTFLQAYASIETGGSDKENDEGITWLHWQDRAKCVVKAGISVNPIAKLSVGLNYQLRTDRRVPYHAAYSTMINLDDINDLGFSGNYHVNDRFTIFLNVENILNRHPLNVAALPYNGIHGLAGVEYKF